MVFDKNSFYAGLSSDEGDEYVKFLLLKKEKILQHVRECLQWYVLDYMCALLSYRAEDGKLTGELIRISNKLKTGVPGSDLGMTQELWRNLNEKRRRKSGQNFRCGEGKRSDAERKTFHEGCTCLHPAHPTGTVEKQRKIQHRKEKKKKKEKENEDGDDESKIILQKK